MKNVSPYSTQDGGPPMGALWLEYDHLIVPDTIVPAQAERRRRIWTPEEKLALAIFERAIADLANPKQRILVEGWARGNRGPYTLDMVAEGLHCSIGAVRDRLLTGVVPVKYRYRIYTSQKQWLTRRRRKAALEAADTPPVSPENERVPSPPSHKRCRKWGTRSVE